jgi:hypothetical protein
MTGADLLVQRRRAPLDQLATDAAGTEDKIIKPAFLCLLADTRTTIAVIEAVLAEPLTLGTHHERDDADNDPDRAGPD